MTRKDELLNLIEDDKALIPLVDEMVYLEEELDKLRKLPKLRVHPTDPSKQKPTPAAKLYKEFLQQYTNVVKVLLRATRTDEADEESPLRKWTNEHFNKRKKDMDAG